MESTELEEIAFDGRPPVLRIYKDGRVERLVGTQIDVPPGIDPKTNVESKDAVTRNRPIPPTLLAEANVIAVSVDYRRAPEHPIPIAYHDPWDALKWVASHYGGNGHEKWLNHHVDFNKVYLSGDSAGANIAHHMAIRIEKEKLDGINLAGIIRVLVCVAEKDVLRHRGWYYCERLKKIGWKGEVEMMETKGEDHVFHLLEPTCDSAMAKLKKVAAFMNQGPR
ncbi:hypothetical protein J1N35_042966 [Gossypium stocksii]|uniref:Alpha/beta hydrolase fold-3 domain-containing protein n=1 Tax=Gossypium stocksii TaxID=47602 RepID=A0A9D3U6K8_9ROSI|nr:hypothetical protein J1N35_042966 [Gossypium stocksii]